MQLRGYEILPCRNILLSPSLSISFPHLVLFSFYPNGDRTIPIWFIIDTQADNENIFFSDRKIILEIFFFPSSLPFPSLAIFFLFRFILNVRSSLLTTANWPMNKQEFFHSTGNATKRNKIKSVYQKFFQQTSFFPISFHPPLFRSCLHVITEKCDEIARLIDTH